MHTPSHAVSAGSFVGVGNLRATVGPPREVITIVETSGTRGRLALLDEVEFGRVERRSANNSREGGTRDEQGREANHDCRGLWLSEVP